MRAAWHSGLYQLGKSPAATQLGEQSVLINSERRTLMIELLGEVIFKQHSPHICNHKAF